MRERSTIAEATYEALRSAGQRGSHRILLYRCTNGCIVLDVLNLPQGVILHSPAYRQSPGVNQASSSPAGRSKNTSDGNRRWLAGTRFAADIDSLAIKCDHILDIALTKDDIRADLDAGHAEIRVSPTGERCPV